MQAAKFLTFQSHWSLTSAKNAVNKLNSSLPIRNNIFPAAFFGKGSKFLLVHIERVKRPHNFSYSRESSLAKTDK